MKKVVYEGIQFNASWAVTKSVDEFIQHEAHQDLSDVQLREAYKLCQDAVNPPAVKSEDAKAAPAEKKAEEVKAPK